MIIEMIQKVSKLKILPPEGIILPPLPIPAVIVGGELG